MGHRNDFIIKGEIKQPSNPVEEALRESEARYRRLFETAQDGIVIIDADTGHITDVNPFLVKLLGYGREEFIGKALWNFGPFRDIRASKSAFDELLQNGYIRYEHLPLETKDGRCLEVEFIGNVYLVGQKRTIQCNIRDFSQRKQAEATRLVLESELQETQKMTAIATLVGGISHQFNYALTVITTGLDLLAEDGRHQDADGYLQQMKTAVDQMFRMTRQLLVCAEGERYRIETMSMSDLVGDCLPLIKSVLKPSIVIETELPSGLPQIYADRDQMQTALLAVLANASEAIGTKGRIRITCCKYVVTEESVKAVSGLETGIYVCLTVEDNGKGMDEETRRRVFEPFFTTKFPGRGLGMAATHGIVNNHGGRIAVASELTRGTIVTLWLPAFFEAGVMASTKRKIRPNGAAETVPRIENEGNGNKFIRHCERSGRNS